MGGFALTHLLSLEIKILNVIVVFPLGHYSYIRALSVFRFPWDAIRFAAVDSVALKFPLDWLSLLLSLLSLCMHLIDYLMYLFSALTGILGRDPRSNPIYI